MSAIGSGLGAKAPVAAREGTARLLKRFRSYIKVSWTVKIRHRTRTDMVE